MIRSSKISIRHANTGKQQNLLRFLAEYRSAVQQSIDYLWKTKITYGDQVFDISEDRLNLPKYVDYKAVQYTGLLSARAVCSAFQQAIDIVRSCTEKRRRLLWLKAKLTEESRSTQHVDAKLIKCSLTKPTVSSTLPARLSSKCIDFSTASEHFDLFIRLKSTGYQPIKLPLHFDRQIFKRIKAGWKLSGGVSVHNDYIMLSQETVTPEKKTAGKTIGIDTGITNVFTSSDGQMSAADPHGHTLATICGKLARKTKGSKAFRAAQEHRKNYINWSINQLNLTGVKQINLEQVNLFDGSGQGNRFVSHFAHRLISEKIGRAAEEQKVSVILQKSPYKSQRCSSCGFVHMKNRKGKKFCCQNKDCGLAIYP